MRTRLAIILAVLVFAGCMGVRKQPHAPGDENLRYMYITVYPDEATLIVTVEFKDATPTFRDQRITRIHEPVNYSIDQRKVKRIQVIVQKQGWVSQTREWTNEVPFDVFIKLNTVS